MIIVTNKGKYFTDFTYHGLFSEHNLHEKRGFTVFHYINLLLSFIFRTLFYLQQDDHLHSFTVKFGSDPNEYSIDCTKPCTVFEVIKSQHNTELQNEMDKSQKKIKKEKIKVSEENLIIKVGKGNDAPIVATHFPCCCVEENQCLTIMIMHTAVEKRREELRVLPKENYSVFFIDKELGKGDQYKSDMVFTCKNIPENCKYFCVYGKKRMTVEEALRQDGRFVDSLTDFSLSDNENKQLRKHTAVVDNLDGKKFKMCKLPPKNQPKAKNPKQQEVENHEEINDLLRKQFPKLKALMESRFPGRSFEKTLTNLKEEKFGKIQQSFSETHRLEKLLKMGKSVCKVLVKRKDFIDNQVTDVCQGTGFVLFDRFILTSAHLFDKCVEGKKLLDQINVSARFQYNDDPETNYFHFYAEKTFIDIDNELDYAVLELKPEGQNSIQNNGENVKVPPGLLNSFGPLPGNGEACLIGHPAGSVRKIDPTCIIEPEKRKQVKIDPTCIIEPEKRKQAVMDHLSKYTDCKFILQSVNHEIKNQGVDDIMMGGEKAEQVAAFNTFMYHGASGSPVFDAHGRIFGIHTGGYGLSDHIIEYAHLLLTIFEKFVINLKESGNDQMLEKLITITYPRHVANGQTLLTCFVQAFLFPNITFNLSDCS
uniref:Serine protease n=1 Tax=Poecilia reticulata TaxID=8081 RepID=A0A3P9NH37_POERE